MLHYRRLRDREANVGTILPSKELLDHRLCIIIGLVGVFAMD
jgi:hypothetical protein